MARFPFESLRKDIKENKISAVSKFTKSRLPKKQADESLKSKHLLLGKAETQRVRGEIKKEMDEWMEGDSYLLTVCA